MKDRKKTKISIIIPTYNRSSYICFAIDSVLAQSYTDFELIIIDDGSTDNTKSCILPYEPLVTYIYQEHKGVSAARNKGIIASAGRYIAFLDSDDRWMPDKLYEQVRFMENNPKANICYSDEVWIRNGVRVNPMKKHKKHSGDIFMKCLPLCTVSPSSVLIKRDLFENIGLFDENLPVCEDYDLWLRIALMYPVFFIDKLLITKYGGHTDQLSNATWGNDRYRVLAMEKILVSPYLCKEKEIVLLEQLIKKCHILQKGYKKRGKIEAARYSNKASYYENKLAQIQ